MNPVADDILMHYGMKYRSGRYPWGSGGQPFQRSGDFLSRVEELKKTGWTETPENIEQAFGMKTTDYRLAKQRAAHERKQLQVDRVKSLEKDGLGSSEIGRIMDLPESTVRSYLKSDPSAMLNRADTTADILRKEMETKGYIGVGAGVERELGIPAGIMQEALGILQAEGYQVQGVGINTGPGKQTTEVVLCPKGSDYKENYKKLYNDPALIQPLKDYHSEDGGSTYNKIEYPSSISSNRVKIRYGNEGGLSKDGVMEIRRGVDDLDLGNSHYAQVRILVDGSHYLKGMAIYSDDVPDGFDIVFNTNKASGTDKMNVLKKIGTDPDNPFGAAIKANGQSYYYDKDGNKKLCAINKLKEEGDWKDQQINLSSQFLSKQPMQLINKQLNLTYADSEAEYDEICSLTNPTIKRKMLADFADNCDSAAVHLKAAALPRQRVQVILPVDKLKENEVYAPNYEEGEKVVLIRYPHGGTFEIPELRVTNKNAAAKKTLGNATDAIGINSKVAERLSGADFDGDTVTVIPVNSKVRVRTTPALTGLKDFDAKAEYAVPEGNPKKVKLLTKDSTQKQMGMISNLITDMTLGGASEPEITRAVKHSMVVIDAAKHKLDYKQSEKDNGIKELKQQWQKSIGDDGTEKYGGASTLLSKRKQDVRIPERRGSGKIDPATGKVTYKESGRKYVDKKTGELTEATQKVKLITMTDDVRKLSSGTVQENAYADYANKMKSLANKARKTTLTTGRLKYDSSAKETYKNEVASLNAKLNIAAKNAPRERRAQAITNSVVNAKKQDNPDLANNKKEVSKIRQQALNNARASVGASGKESRIKINDNEWTAIQSGAITDSKLTQILRYADADEVRKRATPRTTTTLSTARIAKAKNMAASGYNNQEIAKSLNVSASVVSDYLKGKR